MIRQRRRRHRLLLARDAEAVVPTVVLARAWRGGPQPRLTTLLRGCRIEEFTEAVARATGVALARWATRDVVDAAVLVSALSRNDAVVSGDPRDLHRIAGAVGRRLDIRPVPGNSPTGLSFLGDLRLRGAGGNSSRGLTRYGRERTLRRRARPALLTRWRRRT